MANGYIRNQRLAVTSYGPLMSMIVEMLVSAGWQYKASGDGQSGYSSTTKIFASIDTGALGWGNSGAWARIQDPGGGREFTFQHNNNGSLRVKYSASAKFVGGSPSSTVVPTATDEKYLAGDAAGSFGPGFFSPLDNMRGQIWQGLASGTAPYGFWFASQVVGHGIRYSNMMMDPVIGDTLDPDPVVLVLGSSGSFRGLAYADTVYSMGHNNTVNEANFNIGGTNTGCFAHMDISKRSMLSVRPLGYTCGALDSTTQSHISGRLETGSGNLPREEIANINRYGAGLNPFNGKPEYLPVLWSRTQVSANLANWNVGTANPNNYLAGIKGWSTMCRWTGLNRTSFLDTLDNKKWICVGAWWLPWDGITTPRY